jgi:hypothetical protein
MTSSSGGGAPTRNGRSTPQFQKARKQGKAARRSLTDALKMSGAADSAQYAIVTNAVYLGLFGKSARSLKLERGLTARQSLRDHLPLGMLLWIATAEHSAIVAIEAAEFPEISECERIARRVSATIRVTMETLSA